LEIGPKFEKDFKKNWYDFSEFGFLNNLKKIISIKKKGK
jgi:hypothetical protein